MRALKAAVLLPLAFALAVPISALGQSCRFSVGPLASVDTYQQPPYDYDFGPPEGEIRDNTKYSLGLGLYYQSKGRFVLKSGLLYSNKGKTRYYDPFGGQRRVDGSFYGPWESKHKVHYLDVPLLAGIKVVMKEKWSIVPAVGVVSSLLLASTSTFTRPGDIDFVYTASAYSPEVLIAAAFEIGINYQVANRIQLGLSPYYRAGLNLANDIPFQQNPSSFGTSLELRYCLK